MQQAWLKRPIPLAITMAAASLGPWSGHAAAQGSIQLEEVIVTAQKGDDRIQDIPSTVNLVTGEQLQDMQIHRFADLAQVTAGLSLDVLTGRRASLNMRGVQTNPDGGFGDGVAVYWNNMNIRSDVAFQQMFDIDRVEVLRGPQGTLQGVTSPAGAVQLHTRAPKLDGFGGTVQTTLSDNNGFNTEFGVDLPLIANELAIRVAGVYDSADINDGENLTTGRRATSLSRAGRFTLRYEPNDVFSGQLTYEYLEKHADGMEFVAGPAQNGNPALAPEDRNALANVDNRNLNRNSLAALNLRWSLGDHELAWDTGYYNSNQQALRDDDPANIVTVNRTNLLPVTAERFVQELRLSSELTDWWESLVGVYYQKDDSNAKVILAPAAGRQVTVDIPSHGETFAVFTHHRFQVSENGLLEPGLRWQKVNLYAATDLYMRSASTGALLATLNQIPDDQLREGDAETFTASLKYSYTFTPDLMAYLSYDQSFRPGGVTPTTAAISGQYLIYDSEDSQGLELGVKSTWLDNRVRVNANIFYQKFSDGLYRSPSILVNTDGDPGTDGTVRLVFNADSIVQGAELEAEGLITANWRVGTNISYVDAKYDGASIPCNSANPTAQVEEILFCDTSGRVGSEPNWSFTANSYYTIPLGSVEGYINALVKYQSFRDEDAIRLSRVGGFATTNLYLGVRSQEDTWDLSLWVKNLFDKDAQLIPPEELNDASYRLVRPNEGRVIGMTARYNF